MQLEKQNQMFGLMKVSWPFGKFYDFYLFMFLKAMQEYVSQPIC